MNNQPYILKSKRLGLRNWGPQDFAPFAEMCKDREVMRFFPNILSDDESGDLIKRLQTQFDENGYTYFAVDLLETSEFIGFTGLARQTWESDFTPCTDIGWRLKKSAWGKGYATEAAEVCIQAAFQKFNLKEVYAFAVLGNTPSENVMKKLGMHFVKNFNHPKMADYEKFKECMIYKIEA